MRFLAFIITWDAVPSPGVSPVMAVHLTLAWCIQAVGLPCSFELHVCEKFTITLADTGSKRRRALKMFCACAPKRTFAASWAVFASTSIWFRSSGNEHTEMMRLASHC